MVYVNYANSGNSANRQPPEDRPHRSLWSLAKEWGVRPGDVHQAAQELGIRVGGMYHKVTVANEKRIYQQLFAQTEMTRLLAAVPAAMPTVSSKRGSDKSAYLAATQGKADRAAAAARADVDLCECCDIPLPRSQPRGLCHDCRSDGHQQIKGPDRDLTLARRHADRFRTSYLRERDAAERADEQRQAANRRANAWGGALTRLMVEHERDGGKHCPVCKTPAPCAVWRGLERRHLWVADRILARYYHLSQSALDRALNDGIVSEDADEFNPDDQHDDGPDPVG